MNVYIGSSKKLIHVGDLLFTVNSPSAALEPAFDGVVLKSSDGYVFCLADDSYLTVEED